jgi:S1-C subfamily serine protease
LRDGKEQVVSVKLMRTPYVNYYGMRLRNLTKEEAKEFGLKKGVKVAAVENRRLYNRGVSDGDVLLSINGNELKNVDDVDALDEDYIYEVEFLNKDKEKMRFIFE